MRRYARTLILLALLVIVCGLILGFQKIDIPGLERGGDTVLGLSLGLDLQGGSHLVYQAVDPDTGEPYANPPDSQMEGLKRIIEERVNGAGLGEPIIQRLGDDRLLIQLPGVSDTARAKNLIGETARLEFKKRTLEVPRDVDEISPEEIISVTVGPFPLQDAPEEQGAFEQPVAPPALLIQFTAEGAEKFALIMDRLLTSLLPATSILGSNVVPPNRLEISLEGEQSQRFEATGISGQRIGESNRFGFVLPPGIDPDETRALLGSDPVIRFTELQGAVDEDIGLSGSNLVRAYPSQHAQSGRPIVTIEFDSAGTRTFGELTQEIAGTSGQIAIFLDDEELISPTVQTAIITGTAIIQGGDFTIERVRDLALLLEAGALPIPIELIQERDVDAILGADSLAKSATAGMIGLALVFSFMVLYYRVPGVVAAVALIVYSMMVLAIFKLLPITLTLSGVGAIILSVGMAVDANILIFERMKDELRSGRTLTSAINAGFNRAWPAIRDGNVSTLITCGILFYFSDQFGTTVVQGFAVALAIGVLVSMFSAIVLSRTLLRVVALTPLSRHIGLFLPTGAPELVQGPTVAPAPAGS